MPRPSLAIALLISLLLHLSLLALGMRLQPQALSIVGQADAARIDARLLPPAAQNPAEPLLKNTLAEEAAPTHAPPSKPARSAPAASAAPFAPASASSVQQAAQHKLAPHVYYPPEAVARGLEGEVRLLLTLAPDGRLLDAVIAASSGHALLDQAALDAVQAMGALPDAGVAELILPVVFRLR